VVEGRRILPTLAMSCGNFSSTCVTQGVIPHAAARFCHRARRRRTVRLSRV
jgi:hypothetical protein